MAEKTVWNVGERLREEPAIEYAHCAEYCNEHNLVIVELEADEEGRLFEVQEIPEPTQEEKENAVRFYRNNLLQQTDKFMTIDYPISEEEKENYKNYRTYLRDYTLQENWFERNPISYEEFVANEA